MAKAKYDPLEAAKIGTDKPKASPKQEALDDLDVSDVEVAPEPAPEPAPPACTYRVMEAGRFSYSGQICQAAKDSIIDAAGYGGEAGIAKLLAQGLKLERVRG